jgi:hypothetical protein
LSQKADHYRGKWISKVIETLKSPYVVGFELCHEPDDDRFILIAPSIMKMLLENGIPMERIISGVSYFSPDRFQEVNPLYKAAKKTKLWNKRVFSKVIHNVSLDFFKSFWRWQKHSDRCFISDYGCQPAKSKEFWNNVLREWFRVVKKKNKFFKTRSAFEHIYRSPGDDIAGVFGIAKAVYEAYGIKMYTRGPIWRESVFSRAGYEAVTFSETADQFKIEIKGKWYDTVWKIIKAIYEILTGQK